MRAVFLRICSKNRRSPLRELGAANSKICLQPAPLLAGMGAGNYLRGPGGSPSARRMVAIFSAIVLPTPRFIRNVST